MPLLSLQDQLDYMADAQARVAADTLCLTKTASLIVPADGEVALPDDLIALRAVYVDKTPIPEVDTRTLALFLAANGSGSVLEAAWGVLGRTFYYVPRPIVPLSLTIIYHHRPADLTSVGELELPGQYDLLAKDLSTATAAMDTGETEVAIAQQQEYEVEAARLLRARRSQDGTADRVRVERIYP